MVQSESLYTPIGIHIANFAIIGNGRHRKSPPVHVARGWQTLPSNGFPIQKYGKALKVDIFN